MSLNPDTLAEEGDWERKERQARTGVLGNGEYVTCQPSLEDPSIMEMRHRAVCLMQPYPACPACPHNQFELVFSAARQEELYRVIQCPRWGNDGHRIRGYPPDYYMPVEKALCFTRPFHFCSICPAEEELVDIGADKVRSGWYGRWHRFTAIKDDGNG